MPGPAPLFAQYSGGYQWSDPDGTIYKPKATLIECPYTVPLVSMLPVPDGAAAGTEYDLPSCGIMTGASFVWVRNWVGQELSMAWGGNWLPHLPNGGIVVWAASQLAAAGTIISLRFMLTQTQVGPGAIHYALMGT